MHVDQALSHPPHHGALRTIDLDLIREKPFCEAQRDVRYSHATVIIFSVENRLGSL